MSSRYCQFSGLVDSSYEVALRTAQFDGDTYLIVPVIGLIGGAVVRPLNSSGPEYVPSSVLSDLPQKWNGRPVVLDHPIEGSANSPSVLESKRFGWLFNSRFEDNKLKFDAYLSKSKAKLVGEEAEKIISKCENKETVEISIGAYVAYEDLSGVSESGEDYQYVWNEIASSDHLAILREGAIGACSNDMGCGAPRLMQKEGGKQLDDKDNDTAPGRGRFLDRLLSVFGFKSQEMSSEELRDKLSTLLYQSEVGYDWIIRIWPETKIVIYTTYVSGNSYFWKRSYSVSGEGSNESISLSADRVQVESPDGNDIEDWKEVSEATTLTAAEKAEVPVVEMKAAECGCHKNNVEEIKPNEGEEGESTMAENDESKNTNPPPKTEAVPQANPPSAESTSTAGLVSVPAEELAELRAMAARDKAVQTQKRDALVTILKTAQTAFTEDDLRGMPMEHLEKMVTVMNLNRLTVPSQQIDYSGQVLPIRSLSEKEREEQDMYLNPPDPYNLKGLEEARLKKGVH